MQTSKGTADDGAEKPHLLVVLAGGLQSTAELRPRTLDDPARWIGNPAGDVIVEKVLSISPKKKGTRRLS